MALKHLLDPVLHKDLKARSQYQAIEIDDAQTSCSSSINTQSKVQDLKDQTEVRNDVELVDHVGEYNTKGVDIIQSTMSGVSDYRGLMPIKLNKAKNNRQQKPP